MGILGSDIESQATLDEVVDRAGTVLSTSGSALIDRFNTEATALGDRLVSQLSNIVHGALLSLVDVENKLATDGQSLINSLDGWTVTVTLNKPKENPRG